jgi:FOG: Ankyrin repeat
MAQFRRARTHSTSASASTVVMVDWLLKALVYIGLGLLLLLFVVLVVATSPVWYLYGRLRTAVTLSRIRHADRKSGPALAAALCRAVVAGDNALAVDLLAGGASPDSVSRAGVPVLLEAVRRSSYEMTRLLLAHRANPDSSDPASGDTALMAAVRSGDIELVRLLVRHGAACGGVPGGRISPLQVAKMRQNSNIVAELEKAWTFQAVDRK